MGKNTKHLLETYQNSMKNNFNEISSGISNKELLMGYNALRQQTHAALVTSVAGCMVDLEIDNASYRVHSEPSQGFQEAVILKKRLDVMDSLIAKLKAEIEVEQMAIEGQMELFDKDDENVETIEVGVAQGTDD